MKRIASIPRLPFKSFFTYKQVTDFLWALTAVRPDLCRLGSLGPSREDLEVNLLTVTEFASGAPEDKPGYLIHGNIHAPELSGTHAALYTARQLLADHKKSDLLKKVVFYIVPRPRARIATWMKRTYEYWRIWPVSGQSTPDSR